MKRKPNRGDVVIIYGRVISGVVMSIVGFHIKVGFGGNLGTWWYCGENWSGKDWRYKDDFNDYVKKVYEVRKR